MAHPNEVVAAVAIAAVALVSLALLVLALAARRRTGNRKLGFVAAAFAVFVLKSVVTAYAVATDAIHHEDLELLGSLAGLAVVLLLAAPFLAPARAA